MLPRGEVCPLSLNAGSVPSGIAITSGFYPEPHTHVELVRYGAGQDAMGRLATLMVDGSGGRARRLARFLGQIMRHPLNFLRTQVPWGWAKRTVIVLVMQSVDNHLSVKLARPWWWPRIGSRLAPVCLST